MERKVRSLVKALTWRLVASATTGIVVFLFTSDPPLSFWAMTVDFIIKLILYYIHERVWNRVRWGRMDRCVRDIKGIGEGESWCRSTRVRTRRGA